MSCFFHLTRYNATHVASHASEKRLGQDQTRLWAAALRSGKALRVPRGPLTAVFQTYILQIKILVELPVCWGIESLEIKILIVSKP